MDDGGQKETAKELKEAKEAMEMTKPFASHSPLVTRHCFLIDIWRLEIGVSS
jgi:hypothetical protein